MKTPITDKSTPLPWAVRGNAGDGKFGSKTRVNSLHKDFDFSAETRVADAAFSTQGVAGLPKVKEAEANAAFIVLACNSHAALVAALEEAEKALAQLLSAAVMAPASVRCFPPYKLGEDMADYALASARSALRQVQEGGAK